MPTRDEVASRWTPRLVTWLAVIVPAVWGIVAVAARTGPIFR
jgi:hypothetical protein